MDGYRAPAAKSGKVTLYSQLENSLIVKHPYIVEPLADLPERTVVDGELVAPDDDGRPNFNLMQKLRKRLARLLRHMRVSIEEFSGSGYRLP